MNQVSTYTNLKKRKFRKPRVNLQLTINCSEKNRGIPSEGAKSSCKGKHGNESNRGVRSSHQHKEPGTAGSNLRRELNLFVYPPCKQKKESKLGNLAKEDGDEGAMPKKVKREVEDFNLKKRSVSEFVESCCMEDQNKNERFWNLESLRSSICLRQFNNKLNIQKEKKKTESYYGKVKRELTGKCNRSWRSSLKRLSCESIEAPKMISQDSDISDPEIKLENNQPNYTHVSGSRKLSHLSNSFHPKRSLKTSDDSQNPVLNSENLTCGKSFRSHNNRKSSRCLSKIKNFRIGKSQGVSRKSRVRLDTNLLGQMSITWKHQNHRGNSRPQQIKLMRSLRKTLKYALNCQIRDNFKTLERKFASNGIFNRESLTGDDFLNRLGFDQNFDLIFQNLKTNNKIQINQISKADIKRIYLEFFKHHFKLAQTCKKNVFEAVMKLFLMNLRVPNVILKKLDKRNKLRILLIIASKLMNLPKLAVKLGCPEILQKLANFNNKNDSKTTKQKDTNNHVSSGVNSKGKQENQSFDKILNNLNESEFQKLFEGIKSPQKCDFRDFSKYLTESRPNEQNKNNLIPENPDNQQSAKPMQKFVYFTIFALKELLERFSKLKNLSDNRNHMILKDIIRLFKSNLSFENFCKLGSLSSLLDNIDLNILQEFSLFYWTSFLIGKPKKPVSLYPNKTVNNTRKLPTLFDLMLRKIDFNDFLLRKSKKTNEAYKFIQNKLFQGIEFPDADSFLSKPSIPLLKRALGLSKIQSVSNEILTHVTSELSNLKRSGNNWSKKKIKIFKLSNLYQNLNITDSFSKIIVTNLVKISKDPLVNAPNTFDMFSDQMLRNLTYSKTRKPWTTYEILDSIVWYHDI